MIGIFDAVIFEIQIYRQRWAMTFQQINNTIRTSHDLICILCIRVRVNAIRNIKTLALANVSLKTAIGIPAIRLMSIDIANLENSEVDAGILDLLPVNVSLEAAHVNTLCNSALGHVMHGTRPSTKVAGIIVLQVATQFTVPVAPRVCLAVTNYGAICLLLVLGIERLGGGSVLAVGFLVFVRSVGRSCPVLCCPRRVGAFTRLIGSIA